MGRRGEIFLVLALVLLVAEPVVGRPAGPVGKTAEARGLEERLASIGKRAKGFSQSVVRGVTANERASHRAKSAAKKRQLEEDGADSKVKDLQKTTEGKDTDALFAETEKEEKERKASETKKMSMFLVACLVTIIILGLLAYSVNKHNNPDSKAADYFGLTAVAPINVFVGMASGLVFGFIDNAGLFFGMEYLDPFFSSLPKGDEEKVVSGYGNTFSDMIGSFLGTFAGSIVKDLAVKYAGYKEAEEYPIWSEAAGITIGCLIGVAVPRMILGDPKTNRLTAAKADALANGVTQEQIDEVMAEFDRLDKTHSPERPGEVKVSELKKATPGSIDKFIAEADAAGNNDGWVTRDEIYTLLSKANKRFKDAATSIGNKADKTTTDDGKPLPKPEEKKLEEDEEDEDWRNDY